MTTINAIIQVLKNNPYKLVFLLGIVLWITETAYFGFNYKPINGAEKLLDAISGFLIFYGIFGDVLSGITIHKTINENYHYKNTYEKGSMYFDAKAAKYLIEKDKESNSKSKKK